MAMTKLQNLINPEVLGAFLDKKIVDKMVFSQFAEVKTDLVGNEGDTLKMPVWNYVGDAVDLAEGVEGVTDQLTAETVQAKVKKAVKNIELTDEAVLSGHGQVMGQAEIQLLTSIASKVDADCLDSLKGASALTHTMNAVNPDNVADAISLFGEDLQEQIYLVMNGKNLAKLRKDADFKESVGVVSGVVGTIHGALIVVSNKLEDTEAFLIKAGALAIILKRETNVETERNVLKKSTIISADKHYTTYLQDPSKVVKVTIGASRNK